MSIVCYICDAGTDVELIRVPGRRELYVCQQHLEEHMSKNESTHTSDNSICRDCLMNQVAYIYIGETPFKKYCSGCASTLQTNTPGNSKVLISINWKNIIKGRQSLDTYRSIKARIKVIKNKCFKFVKNFEEEVNSLEIEHYSTEVFSTIDSFFDEQVKVLRDHQEEYTAGYKNLLKSLKSEIIARNEGNSRLLHLLDSENELNNLKCLKIAQIDERLDFNEEFFYSVKLKQLSELIYGEYVYVFFKEKAEIFEFSTSKQNIKKYQGPGFIPWKINSFWCTFENEDILYTGGVYNKVESGKCFLINPKKEMNICINNCVPRQGHTIVVHEDNGYLFGGNTLVCEKFVHKENVWLPLVNSPKIIKQATSILDNRQVFITGLDVDQVFIYSIRQNLFLDTNIRVVPKQKLLLRLNGKIYLLVDNIVFLFNPTGFYFEKKRQDNLNKNTTVMEAKITDTKVYWVTAEGDLCSFSDQDEKTCVEMPKRDFLKN